MKIVKTKDEKFELDEELKEAIIQTLKTDDNFKDKLFDIFMEHFRKISNKLTSGISTGFNLFN